MTAALLTTPNTLLPGIAARDDATPYTDALWDPLVEIDDQVREYVAGVEDLHEADGLILDLLGDWVSEARLGLGDAEYRRLIAGRRVATEQTAVAGAVYRGWLGLTDAYEATLTEAAGDVALAAFVSYTPSTAWVQRIGVVARDLVAAGVSVYGLIAPPGTFLWGVHSFDDAGFAFDFGG